MKQIFLEDVVQDFLEDSEDASGHLFRLGADSSTSSF